MIKLYVDESSWTVAGGSKPGLEYGHNVIVELSFGSNGKARYMAVEMRY